MKQIVGLVFIFAFNLAFGQDDTTSTLLDDVDVFGKKTGFKKIGLYDETYEEDYNIRGFTQLVLFENDLTDEFWTSKGASCISSKLTTEGDNGYLNLKWNKDLDGCDWVGLGFGWDGWSGKDMGYVIDTLALELQVRSLNGESFTNLPWAFGIEDYSGQQAWLGYNTSFLQTKAITREWSKVQIPLSLFPFAEQDIDLTVVKQLLIQVFAEGSIEIKKIHLVPFSKKLKKEVLAKKTTLLPVIDGSLVEWEEPFTDFGDGHKFAVKYSEEKLFFAFKVKDETARVNKKAKGELWNGDGIEIAFATNPMAPAKRKFLLLSDQHIGINCGDSPYVWDWKEGIAMEAVKYSFAKAENGYILELMVPFTALYDQNLSTGLKLDFEVAIDLGDGDSRKEQVRWNSGATPGFHTSPAKWGVLILE